LILNSGPPANPEEVDFEVEFESRTRVPGTNPASQFPGYPGNWEAGFRETGNMKTGKQDFQFPCFPITIRRETQLDVKQQPDNTSHFLPFR
jgi:hypothetical protein